MPHLTWTPVFEDQFNQEGPVVKVRFIMYTDKAQRKIADIVETGTDFASLLNAVDIITDKFGQSFSTMIDTGAITLVETVQVSIYDIVGQAAWEAHLEYLLAWEA